jgi:hypothetical protein
MRTTLTIDDQIAKALKALAHRSGKPFKKVVNETLQAGLNVGSAPSAARPYRVKPVSLGGVHPGIDVLKALRLADALEDDEIARKLELRK